MRSVVVVLPASMCAMIPMLRVFSSGNLRGMDQLLDGGGGIRNGPIGPAHTTGSHCLSWRYVPVVSIVRGVSLREARA
jgi:hypothetical protein